MSESGFIDEPVDVESPLSNPLYLGILVHGIRDVLFAGQDSEVGLSYDDLIVGLTYARYDFTSADHAAIRCINAICGNNLPPCYESLASDERIVITRAGLNFMTDEEGFAYTTKDDDHFLLTDDTTEIPGLEEALMAQRTAEEALETAEAANESWVLYDTFVIPL